MVPTMTAYWGSLATFMTIAAEKSPSHDKNESIDIGQNIKGYLKAPLGSETMKFLHKFQLRFQVPMSIFSKFQQYLIKGFYEWDICEHFDV